MAPFKQHLLRIAAALGIGTLTVFSAAATAGAATPGPDLTAASGAAHSAQAGQLLDKAAQQMAQRSGLAPSAKAASAKAALVVQQDTVPVYALSADFVRSRSNEVGTLWYVATKATKGSAVMTVYTAPDKATGAWQPVNIATGDTEAKMAAAAHGAKVLTEPQIGAWYAVSGNQIRALDPDGIKAIGTKPISLTSYRQQVAARYADKQAGSAYAKNGTAGGYDVSAAAPATAEVQSESNRGAWMVLVGGAGVAVICGLLTVVARRRRVLA
ncbi:hypothetical protein F1D05_01250 [Kribbella qitaiheensis]|uniref:Uncharacterized protein n=1 Tax=Kribbella qitaiheensis TaxID=1544730 RepID=A0A7G6WS09_9ACTN|nr:hypothetical protein [Kribbella qitaiheensis]QNE16774.1 hypothetical protein F1D05_01250 [Kribbella qitaiheensis]